MFSEFFAFLGRGYPELDVHVVEDELEGDSLSERTCPNAYFLSYASFVAPFLDKLSNVATADVFSINPALFNEYT